MSVGNMMPGWQLKEENLDKLPEMSLQMGLCHYTLNVEELLKKKKVLLGHLMRPWQALAHQHFKLSFGVRVSVQGLPSLQSHEQQRIPALLTILQSQKESNVKGIQGPGEQ